MDHRNGKPDPDEQFCRVAATTGGGYFLGAALADRAGVSVLAGAVVGVLAGLWIALRARRS